MNREKWDEAIKCFEKVISIDERVGDMVSVLRAKMYKTQCLMKIGKNKEAMALLLEIMEQVKAHPEWAQAIGLGK